MTIEEKRNKLHEHYDMDTSWDNDGFINFYYRCMEADLDLLDADAYATLNTLLGYDIGMDNARSINCELWERDIETRELGVDNESKEYIRQASESCGIVLDFSKWRTEPYKWYSFFEDEDIDIKDEDIKIY